MGLDISVYRQLRQVTDLPPEESDERYELLHVFNIDEFAGREVPLTLGAHYTTDAERDCFRAGSYSGYGRWREQLAAMAGYPPVDGEGFSHRHSNGAWNATEGPFWELICFADNEGVIGSVAAAKLALDFAAHDEMAKGFAANDLQPWFYEMYQTWRRAFEAAADGGAVEFH